MMALMFFNVVVRDDERAFLTRDGRFERLLEPGRHREFDPRNGLKAEVVKVVQAELPAERALLYEKTHPRLATENFVIVQPQAHEVAIVSMDGAPKHLVLPHTTRAFWKTLTLVEVETIDTQADMRVAKEHLVERLRADWRDEDTRANLEWIQRRLAELEEIERQREEQQQEQQDQEQDPNQEGEPDEKSEPEEGDESEEQDEESEDEGEESDQDPSEREDPSESDPQEPQGEEEAEEPPPPAGAPPPDAGALAAEITRARWGGSVLLQDLELAGVVRGPRIERASLVVVDAGDRELARRDRLREIDLHLAASFDPAAPAEIAWQARIDGKDLVLARFPLRVVVRVFDTAGRVAEATVTVEE